MKKSILARVDYSEIYNIAGNVFTVNVQHDDDATPYGTERWFYEVKVRGHVIEASSYSWNWEDRGRHLTNKGAANHVASFWGPSKLIEDAQDLEGTPEYELDEIVLKCAKKMFEHFEETSFDYDIITKHLDQYGWEVMLMPNLSTAKNEKLRGHKEVIFSFKKFAPTNSLYMTTYNLHSSFALPSEGE